MMLVYSEDHKLSFELLGKARELSNETIAVIIGSQDDALLKEYASHGADKIIVVETTVGHVKAEESALILNQLIESTKSDIILIGSTKNGKELSSRLAGMLNSGCVIDAINIYVKDDMVTTERVEYSGNAIAIEQFLTKPAIITVPSKVFDVLDGDDSRNAEAITKKISLEKSGSEIINIAKTESGGANVEEAEVIVSCGRGFKNKEDINLANDLATVLKGKTVGCSRPIAADLKWLPEDHWIGLSGHKVKPQLYVAAGISGQIQHIAGMRDSAVVVAINKDPDALIFNSADYGIVGDLYKVLPKLTDAIKEKMG